MRIFYFIFTILFFKKRYLKNDKTKQAIAKKKLESFFKKGNFNEKLIYGVPVNDIITFSFFGLSFSFPAKFYLIYYNSYNPPDIIGRSSGIPRYFYYSQYLINTFENKFPSSITYKDQEYSICYID